ncbi:MAG TPA: MFS transporter [Actinocrinis sp.]|jgi:MFS family permease|uniref:MFS transporter n=1 Tax=Actinocrinis sp. TaxID=1920516 RepID=UPI002DDDB925|nr:MFS transporter [Actinocrinis sp.]HEV3171431.1 MFS transporter [Actinocrinis sp.]
MTADASTAEQSTVAPKSLWRHRDFLLLWGGQTISEMGSSVSQLALPLLAVTVIKATTFEVSVLNFLSSLAFLLIALPAGVVVDRVRKRGLMLWCDFARMLLMGSIPIAAILWHVTLWQLYAVAGAVGVLTVFFDVAYQSYLPVLIDKEQLVDGNGKLGTTQSIAQFVGPSLGGALVGFIGAAKTISADAISYAVSTLSLALIRKPEPRAEDEPRAERVTFRAAMAEGLQFVVKHPILRKIVACTGSSNFFSSSLGAVEIVFLIRSLHATPTEVGLVFTLGSVGGLLGGTLAGRLAKWVGSARIIWLSQMISGPFGLLIAFSQPRWGLLMFAFGYVAFWMSAVVYNVAQVSYRQAICPPELLGRMNASVRWIVWGTMPIGALFGGALGTAIGLRPTLFVSVIGGWAAGLFVVFSPLRRMRDVPQT